MRNFRIRKNKLYYKSIIIFLNRIKKDKNFNKISCIFKELILLIKFITYWFIIIIAFMLLLGNSISNKIYKIILTALTLILDLFENINILDLRLRVIHETSYKQEYLIKYSLFLKDRNYFPFNIFIQKYMKGDECEHMYDQPWGFFHIILSGGYWEEVPHDQNDLNKGIQKIWREPGYWNCVSADYKHRLKLKDNIKPWCIFIPLNKRTEWGFWVKKNEIWEKIPSHIYIKNKHQ
tara:strand:+ start:572 stop:1276 length:705 start_codon:yes stop_codon:yes gene_type:complete